MCRAAWAWLAAVSLDADLACLEVALWKSVGLLAGILILPNTAAGAETLVPAEAPCTRQSAIWLDLFQNPSAPRLSCGAHRELFSTPAAEPADVGGERVVSRLSSAAGQTAFEPAATPAQAPVTSPRPTAFEYSHAYTTRRKIHFIASFATIPLFVTQYVLGDQLYEGTSGGSTKSAHSGVAVGIETLFAVNTVTGVWNMWESRKDPNAGKKRFIHGFLMLGADVGFVATGMLAPDDEGGGDNRSTHRNVAIASMAVATASYLIMLIGR